MRKLSISIALLAVVAVSAGAYYNLHKSEAEPTISTAPVTTGDIIDTVGATGALQAVTTVQVGSQVSGNISWLGADFNSIVRKGQVIARLDPSLLQTQIEQARANLVRAQADVERLKVGLDDARNKLKRATELAARSLISQSDLETAQVDVHSVEAQLRSAEAQVTQAQASLNQNQVNLDHAIITAPIDGIVIQRSVDVGQTVAASLQSPTIFIIAADLTKMQVNANIDEADVGRIRPGQHVTFRVDAYPTDDFEGTVSQIRLQPVVVQNVTTYNTIVDVPNPELKLKPGMTANIKIEIASRSGVLRVPNTALRFRATADMFAALNQAVPPPEPQFAGGGSAQGRQGGAGGSQSGGRGPVTTPSGAPAASSELSSSAEPPERRMGAGAQPGRSRGGGGPADQGDRNARLMERLKDLSPEERQQTIERMRGRGFDVSRFEPVAKKPAAAPSRAATAQTIDALFAPLPAVESTGRAWLYIDKQLKPVRLRLGISDGTTTELLSGELQPGMELVTGMIFTGARPNAPAGQSNPLMPGRGGMGGGGRGR